MGSIKRRAGRLETVISICILAILLIIAAGVILRQADTDMSRFGIVTAKTQLSIGKSQQGQEVLALAIPDKFEQFSPAEIYTAENLYEKIDGKAGFYIECGFEKLFSQRFISKTDASLWMELFIYDMSAIKNAFSVYSTQKRADAEAVELFQPLYGYKTSNALFFVHGKYYVELLGSSEANELIKAMMQTAQKVQTNLTVSNDTIAELAFFPSGNIISSSIKLYRKNAFGFAGLNDTFVARYEIDGEIIAAFFSKQSDPKDAEAIAANYRNFLIENGATVKNTNKKTLTGKVLDCYGTNEIMFATGSFAAGIHEAENQQAAENLAVMLINKLSEAAKTPK